MVCDCSRVNGSRYKGKAPYLCISSVFSYFPSASLQPAICLLQDIYFSPLHSIYGNVFKLRIQDFKALATPNPVLFQRVSRAEFSKICGEDT